MKSHFELSDAEFLTQFESLLLDPGLFSHEAHLRLGWLYIHKFGIHAALQDIPIQIQKFATRYGDPDKYHHSLTVSAVHTIHHFYNRSNKTTFQDFLNEFPRLTHSFKSLLLSHYSSAKLFSSEAKRTFVQPDLIPFDAVV